MKKGLIVVGVIALILVGLVVGRGFISKPVVTEVAETTAVVEKQKPVAVVGVELTDLEQTLRLHGKLRARSQVTVLPEVTGKVTKVFVQVGDVVKAGDLLVQLDTEDLELQVRQAQAALDGVKANLQRIVDGARPEEIQQAEATLEQAEANYANAKLTYERSKKLFESGVLARKDWDAVQAQFTVAEAQKLAAEKTLDLVKKGARDTDIAATKASVRQAEVALESAKNRLADASIKAPIGGTVSRLDAEVGNMAGMGTPLATLVDTSLVEISLQVGEKQIVQISPGQPVRITLDALPKNEFVGRVKTVAPAADAQSGLFEVIVEAPNPNSVLKPGMYASTQISTQTKTQVVAIPETALLTAGGQPRLFVVQDNRAIERNVVLGIRSQGFVEIVEGVGAGETLVVSGQEFLHHNDLVNVTERGESK